MKIELLNIDCMEYMATVPDKYFDLAIVDPPYGVKGDSFRSGMQGKKAKSTNYHAALWDQPVPDKDYFLELKRVSKNQIIWGANHFAGLIPDPSSPCWVVWDKNNTGDFADCELAYTSFKTAVRKFSFTWNGMLQGDMANKEKRIHPTQKPVKLYQWLLNNYAKTGQKILDTHLGSGSSAIAAHYFCVSEFVGCELDKVYFDAACARITLETSQTAMVI